MINQLNLFPISVYATILDVDKYSRANMINSLYKLKEESDGIQVSNNGGWHSESGDILSREDFLPLRKKIIVCLEEIVDKYYHDVKKFNGLYYNDQTIHQGAPKQIDFDELIFNSWAIINKQNHSNHTHMHPNNWLSGVYYLKVPEDSGDLKFLDMISSRLHEGNKYWPTNLKQELRGSLRRAENTLFIFPAWLLHSVGINKTSEDRICISFNIPYPYFGVDNLMNSLLREGYFNDK